MMATATEGRVARKAGIGRKSLVHGIVPLAGGAAWGGVMFGYLVLLGAACKDNIGTPDFLIVLFTEPVSLLLASAARIVNPSWMGWWGWWWFVATLGVYYASLTWVFWNAAHGRRRFYAALAAYLIHLVLNCLALLAAFGALPSVPSWFSFNFLSDLKDLAQAMERFPIPILSITLLLLTWHLFIWWRLWLGWRRWQSTAVLPD